MSKPAGNTVDILFYRWALLAVLSLVCASLAQAGELTRETLQRHLPTTLRALDKLSDIAAWPLVIPNTSEPEPIGYAFESVDFAPIPGYEGTPVNLLVVVDRQGNFIHMEVLQQHEPMFVFSGLGEEPLREFVRQYVGKNLTQEIAVGPGTGAGNGQRTVIDGIAKATATVRVVHKSILSSALAVARAKLGLAGKRGSGPIAQVRGDVFEHIDFEQLLRQDMVGRLKATNAEVEQLFAGTEWAGLDPDDALRDPNGLQVDMYVAYLNVPTIGRALLGDLGYQRLMEKLEPGQSAFWIASAGRSGMEEQDFPPGGEPQHLSLNQGGLPLELRDLVFDCPKVEGAPHFRGVRILTVFAEANLDPGQPLDLSLRLVRAKGMGIPRVMEAPLHLSYQVPLHLLARPAAAPDWFEAWQARATDLAVIGLFLTVLSLLLMQPRSIAADPRRLRHARLGALAFTLGYLGWGAQGQLSIVQLIGGFKALLAGRGLGTFLYDPVALLLIGFTTISFLIWGRGTFCGWLCPFGALQEFVGLAARRLGIPQYRPSSGLATRLPRLRYGVLALLCLTALIAPEVSEDLTEVEPFKTAITVGFDRSWPFVAYALALLAAGACYFKFFCRILCPLGAAMSLGGLLRRWNWVPRRHECGQPCQTCRARCDYDAIDRDGTIRYSKCFQCLDCVGVYHDASRCAPLLLYRRKGKTIPLRIQSPR